MYKAALSACRLRVGNSGKILPLALMLCIIFIPSGLAQEKEKLLRTLTVSGRGVETIPTTLSQVSLSVEVQGKTAQLAQEEAARRSSAVVALLKNRNVEKLQTTGIRLNPVYSYTDNVQRITGYAANNTVSFRITTDKAGMLLDEAVKVGATQINGVSFVANDQAIASAQKEALRQATQDAQQQANAVLSTLGFQAQEVVGIQINGASAPPPPMLQRAEVAKLSSADASTPIVGGEQEIEASVTLQISY
ncbi:MULTISPECIES: SIMPL domain-containing protein [Cyanophyceae]|uniref:SIMPL domain-containing protein n=1 Tax=Cyanophyceae TaxID=3028117 RepID=UPI00232A87DC|nr:MULTISPECIES: SIMPL domain-containing protein [Cyanophyceae]MDB9356484.1 SIMPL domain-containing protein [Nodularia spumigena CS-587/03]MDB9337960.1 SIMPL domain-containing protein [Nodularia spumigena CS-589/07]MDB9400150.1 SIMPL domain-containing protein [Microcystis aeruginosa CS-567/02-A1]MDB9497621.1 SIMPL domain-containing protein [Nodularia spumigena CS-336/02]MDB9531106.1 SIMPL domain-containing protein [Nodularia spumigena CS-1038]